MLFLALLFYSQLLYAMSDQISKAIKHHTINGQKQFAIVVPTYNNSVGDICIRNIKSLLGQAYDNFHVYIVDDCSTDGTYEKIKQFLQGHPRAHMVTLIRNEQRIGALANYYMVICQLEDHVIVLNVDGDDWLAYKYVLYLLNKAYDKEIWLTYGQFKEYPSRTIGFCKPIDQDPILKNNYRHSPWRCAHLRTYYAWLFKKIDVRDFYYNGRMMMTCADRAIMYPLLEMAAGRFLCMDRVLYCYNCSNVLADVKVNLREQQQECHHISLLPAYEPLDKIIVDNALKKEEKWVKR